jgi:hypothetical protein
MLEQTKILEWLQAFARCAAILIFLQLVNVELRILRLLIVSL